MSKWLVTGAGGQLGHDVVALLRDADEDVTAVTRADLDITDPDAIEAGVAELGDGIVVNCAAYTAVDDAESDEDTAHAINGVAPGLLADACKRHGARLVHVSTDYVFAGDEQRPYDEETRTAPRTAYGRTKLAGEHAVLDSGAHAFVVRTAWVYGATGNNFVRTMAQLAQQRDALTVVDDQVGSPTWTTDLARGLVGIATSDVPPGIWHCTNSGETSWCGFARAIFEELGLDPDRVQPTTTDKFPRPAPRPAYSVLSGAKWAAAGLPVMPPWRDALHEAFETSRDQLTAARP